MIMFLILSLLALLIYLGVREAQPPRYERPDYRPDSDDKGTG